MKEKTLLCDQYLWEHFGETCHAESKLRIGCSGVELADPNLYTWDDVVLSVARKCRECPFTVERCGIYYGKGIYSQGFESCEYVKLYKIQTQEELETVCARLSPTLKGLCLCGRISDATPLKPFDKLEFIYVEGQSLSRLWDLSCHPALRYLMIRVNDRLQSLAGLEGARALECLVLQVATSRMGSAKLPSLAPLSALPRLKELVLSGTEPMDHNIGHLLALPALEYLWLSPNLYPMECYAEFEAKRWMLGDAYGIFIEQDGDVYPYGKGERVMQTEKQRTAYLQAYLASMEQYKRKG